MLDKVEETHLLYNGKGMKRISSRTAKNSRRLRKNMTDVERILWKEVRGSQLLGYKFRRQHPIDNYIVDFVCLELKIIIELDGSHHFEQAEYDYIRSNYLMGKGFRVLRFWNNDVLYNVEGVLITIFQLLPSPFQPSLKREGKCTKCIFKN